MKVLVTGASGFVGSHLCRRMLAVGHEVRAFRRPGSDVANLHGLELQYAVGDVTNRESVRRAVSGCDAVVHAAAVLSYWAHETERLVAVNVDGTENVAASCLAEGAAMVNVSSVAAIGIPARNQPPATEEFAFNLDGSGLAYHLSKHRGEEVVASAVARGLRAVTVNPGTIFGPNGRRYRGEEMIDKVRYRNVVPYFVGGICIVHVDDVVSGIMACLDRPMKGDRYILGGDNLTYRDIVEKVATKLGLRRQFVAVPPAVTALAAAVLEPLGRMKHQRPHITHATVFCSRRNTFYDSTKARRELGYIPRGFDLILDDALQFFSETVGNAA